MHFLNVCIRFLMHESKKNENFDDENDKKIIDRNDEKSDETEKIKIFDSKTNETTNCWTDFDFNDTFSERSRTNSNTKIEKVDNFDENDMFVKSNINIEIVNLIAW